MIPVEIGNAAGPANFRRCVLTRGTGVAVAMADAATTTHRPMK
jgi:hypothetical protein